MSSTRLNWEKCKECLKRVIIRLSIRFNWLKQVRYDEKELNEMIDVHLPHKLELPVASGNGTLDILSAELSMPVLQDKLHIDLYCSFVVSVAGHDIYRAHLAVHATTEPYFSRLESALKIRNTALHEINLVKDDYAFIESTTEIIKLFLPGGFRAIFATTMVYTLTALQGIIPFELLNYLNLYTSGSKQRILDFHTAELEQTLLEEIEQSDVRYTLDENDFEESLFAEFGKSISIQDGFLQFNFKE